MKKNHVMRAGAFLLVSTMITSCFVGSTFAKYVSTGYGEDTARVAKWGVEVTGAGDAFAKAYSSDNGITVESTVPVIAPGTQGEFKGITLSGTPEVAVDIQTEVTVDLTGNWTVDGEFYCPLVFYINGTVKSGLDADSAEEFEQTLKDAIEPAASGKVDPGVNLADPESNDGVPTLLQKNDDGTSKIKWEWKFDGDGRNQTDTRDTELGNNATQEDPPTIYLKLDTTVTQID